MTGDEVAVVVPVHPPVLGERGLRALLRILTAAMEDDHGPEWRNVVQVGRRD